VTLTDYLPRLSRFERTARKPKRTRHRAVDEVTRQKALRTGADLLIKGLRLQLEEQEAAHAAVIARIDERHGEIVRGLEQQLAELKWRLGIACQASAAADQTQEIPAEVVRQLCIQPVPLHQAPFASTDPGQMRAEGVA
jgi:hypothetical protein